MKRYLFLILLIVGCNTNGIRPNKLTSIKPIPIAVLSSPQTHQTNTFVKTETPRGKEVFKTQAVVQSKPEETTPAKAIEIPKKKKSFWEQVLGLIIYYSIVGIALFVGLHFFFRWHKEGRKKLIKESQK
jgi:hypothetical protein